MQNFIKQLEIWHENDAHQKIIDAIESIPENERSYELTNLLARAYNNISSGGLNDRCLENAVALLESVSKTGDSDPVWQYRMGYSLFYLYREEEALTHFEKAAALNPDEEDIQYFIIQCKHNIKIKKIIEKVEQLNSFNHYFECIELIESVPETERGYILTLWLARIYDNLAIFGEGNNTIREDINNSLLRKALEVLESISAAGKDDPRWNSRMAYTICYMDSGIHIIEALYYAQRWKELEPDNPYTDNLIKEIKKSINIISPFLYNEDDRKAVETHIETNFGEYCYILRELNEDDIHVDVCAIPPDYERNFYTLVTVGMGAYQMNVPKDLKGRKIERAELMICIPPYWELSNSAMQDKRWYWPIRLLKMCARIPIEEESFIAWGHTITGISDGEKPYDDSVGFTGVMLISPGNFGEDSFVCELSNGDDVNFYSLIPLYPEEVQFKIDHGAGALLDLMQSDPDIEFLLLSDPTRRNYCSAETLEEVWAQEFLSALYDWETEQNRESENDNIKNENKYAFCVTLSLNARFQTKHRHYLENAFDDILDKQELGEVLNGSGIISEKGEVERCEIEIGLRDGGEETLAELIEIIRKYGVPKGSELITEYSVIPIGNQEGMAVYLNGTELSEKVYHECNVNYVIEKMNALMNGAGRMYSWWESFEGMALYFYGESYENMLESVKAFLDEYPLCQKCSVVRIA